ncbi:chromatin organization modifier domain-containing protein [Hirsutella rhossiliensis]
MDQDMFRQHGTDVPLCIYQAQANKHRTAAPRYEPGDWVYLNLRNVKTSRPCKKLDWLHAKYQVLAEVNPHTYSLSRRPTPASPGDPLPSQKLDQESAPPVLVDGEKMYLVERILDERMEGTHKKVLVKWHDYSQPTWEPLTTIRHTDAWKQWKKHKRSVTFSSHLATDCHDPRKRKLQHSISLNPTQSVIVALVKQLPEQTYHVFFDNLFSSPNLLNALPRVNCGFYQPFVEAKKADTKGDCWPWGTLKTAPTPDGQGLRN